MPSCTPLLLLLPLLPFPLTLLTLLQIHGGQNHLHPNPHCTTSHPPTPHSHTLLQISDIHLSPHRPTSYPNFQTFLNHTLPKWHPSALVITGDIVDSITPTPLGHRSTPSSHWPFFHSRISSLPIPTLIAPGNHDSFGQPPPPLPPPTLHLPDLTLVALDFTLRPSPHRPLNFFGDASNFSLPPAKALIAFGHYPASVLNAGHRLHHAGLLAYLSGHLHTLRNAMPDGMQATSSDGTLHLQVPDLVDKAVYRVLVVDQGVVAFRDVPIMQNSVVVVTNPPRVGLCSRGAGAVAQRSSHVRVVADDGFDGGEVEIDGEIIGALEKAEKVWTVAWNASRYEEGVHELVIWREGVELERMQFALHGVVPSGMRHVMSAIFVLSRFDVMARQLCWLGFVWCMLFLWPGLRKSERNSLVLFAMIVVLVGGPFVISPRFTEKGWGAVGLLGGAVRGGWFRVGVDVPHLMSVTVLYASLLPVCFLQWAIARWPVLKGRIVTRGFAAVYHVKIVIWCREVFVAYGVVALLVSPSCLMLFGVCAYVTLTAVHYYPKEKAL